MTTEQRDRVQAYDRDLWELEARSKAARRYEQIFQLYAVVGAVMGVAALLYFLFSKLQIELTKEEMLALMTSGVSFLISIISFGFLYLRRQTYKLDVEKAQYFGSASDFLVQWVRFENAGRAALEAEGSDFNRMSVRDILGRLVNDGRLTPSEATMLEETVRFRNALVHGGQRIAPTQLARFSSMVENIANRLESQQGVPADGPRPAGSARR